MKLVLAALASAVFLGLVAFEVNHDLIQNVPWTGYLLVMDRVVWILAPLWLVGAVSVWLRGGLSWLGIVPGAFAALTHGVGVLAGGSRLGVLFVVASAVLWVLAGTSRRLTPYA